MEAYDDLIEAIKQRVSLRALAEEAGAHFRRNTSTCPLHGGDNPTAFHLYANDTRWKCFTNCPPEEAGGDVITFYRAWRHVDFPTAIQELARRAGLDPQPTPSPSQHRAPAPTAAVENLGGLGRLSAFSGIGGLGGLDGLAGGEGGGSPELTGFWDGSSGAWSGPDDFPLPEPPPVLWQERARTFARWAQRQLWSPNGGIAHTYLRQARLLEDPTIHTWALGWNPRLWKRDPSHWGLIDPPSTPPEPLLLHPGIVIPHLDAPLDPSLLEDDDTEGAGYGQVWAIKIRVFHNGKPVTEPGKKYRGPRGGRAVLFGQSHFTWQNILLLTEGELDCILAWQEAGDLCDVATLAGAGMRLHPRDMLLLTPYHAIISVSDADAAGDRAREYFRTLPRFTVVPPPAHDLTDYALRGGDLRAWVKQQVQAVKRPTHSPAGSREER